MKKTTASLGRGLTKNKTKNSEEYLSNWVKENKDELRELSLASFMGGMLEKYSVKKADIIKRADIDTTYAYQIFQGKKKKPDREVLLQLAFGFGMSVEDTGHLLYYGGAKGLYPRVKRDAYIMFALHNKFSLQKTNELLVGQDLEILGK